MKTLKSMVIALALIGLSATSSNAGSNSASISSFQQMRGVTVAQVITYLSEHGYTCLTTPYTEDGGYTYYCITSSHGLHYDTIVHTNGESIVGFEVTVID